MLPDMFSRWSIFFLLSSEGLASTFHIRHYPVHVGGRGDSAYDNGAVEGGQQRLRMRKDQRQQKRWIADDKYQRYHQDEYLEVQDQNDLDDYADYGYADYIYVPPSPVVAFGPVDKNFNVQGLFNFNAASGVTEMTVDGLPCSQVWKYKQKIFFGCTASRAGPLWCSTNVDSENNHMQGHWGWCAPDQVRPKPNRMPGSSCSDGFGVCRLKCQLDEQVAVDPFMENSCSPIGVPLCCIKADTTGGPDVTNTDVSGSASGDDSTIPGTTSSSPDTNSTNLDANLISTSSAPGTNTTTPDNVSENLGASTTNYNATIAAPGANTNNPGADATNHNATTPDTNGATYETNSTDPEGVVAVLHVSTFSPDANTTKASTNAPVSGTAGFTPAANVTNSPNPEAAGTTSGTNANNIVIDVPGTKAPNPGAVVATSSSNAANINTAVTVTGTFDVNPGAASAAPGTHVSGSAAASIAGTIASSTVATSNNAGTNVPNLDAAGVTFGTATSNPGIVAITSGDNAANLVGATSQLPSLETPANPIGYPADAAESGGYESETMDLSAGGSEGSAPAASEKGIAASESELFETMAMDTNQSASNNQVSVSSSDSIVQPKKREVSSSKGSILQALLSKVEDIAAEYEDESVASNSDYSVDETSKTEDKTMHDDNVSSQYVDDIVKSDEQTIADDSSQSAASDDIEKNSESDPRI